MTRLHGKQIEKITQKPFEDEINKKYIKEDGWHLLTSKGFPDYILFNKNTKELILYELKANNHKFHPFQKQIIKILTTAQKRSARVMRYKVDLDTHQVKLEEENDALVLDVKKKSGDWEKVGDIGVI